MADRTHRNSARQFDVRGIAGIRIPDWVCAILALVFLTFLILPVLSGGYFADDFEFAFDNPSDKIFGAFARLHPYELYRPIEFSVSALARTTFGETTLPVHALNLLLHGGLILLCLRVLVALRAPRLSWFFAAAWMVVSQTNAAALGGNDTFSLVLGTLTGTWAVWLMVPRGTVTDRRLSAALALFGVSLLAKESSLGYLPVLAGLSTLSSGGALERRRVVLRRVAGFVIVTAVYMAIRQSLGAELPDSTRRTFGVGVNLVVNSGLIWFAALTPVSTLDLFTGAVLHDWLWPILGVLGALVVSLIMAAGTKVEGRWRWTLLVAAAGECAILPTLFLLHVSELYSYALLPFVAVVFGWSVGALFQRGEIRAYRLMGTVLLGLILLSQAYALRQKAVGMAQAGKDAAVLMPSLLDVARTLPEGAALVVIHPVPLLPEYSVYRMTGFRLTPGDEIVRLSGRSDIIVCEEPDLLREPNRPAVRVAVEGGRLKVVSQK